VVHTRVMLSCRFLFSSFRPILSLTGGVSIAASHFPAPFGTFSLFFLTADYD